MIKLSEKDLHVLEEAIDIINALRETSTEDERDAFNITSTLIKINGLVLYNQFLLNKEGK